MTAYPKRLIEVDLPIARISAYARAERRVRSGRITKLHMWWAHRPLAACRPVLLASLLPDPVELTEWLDEAGASGDIRAPRIERLAPGAGIVIRPARFLDEAKARMRRWAFRCTGKASSNSIPKLVRLQKDESLVEDPEFLRAVLMDFIADFANWDNATDAEFLATSRALVQAAHEALGGDAGTRPIVMDPFAGGGSIPLEALRLGADAFASDLNPIPVLLNTILLEAVPKYAGRLSTEVAQWGVRLLVNAESRLSECYPASEYTKEVLAVLWARTAVCEGPACGVEFPLFSRLQVTTRAKPTVAVRLDCDGSNRVRSSLYEAGGHTTVGTGTARGGKLECPCCGHTMPAARYRALLKEGRLGERMYAVIERDRSSGSRTYREIDERDTRAFERSETLLAQMTPPWAAEYSTVPDEELSQDEPRRLNVRLYGYERWGQLFNARQALALASFGSALAECRDEMDAVGLDSDLAKAVTTVLGLAISNGSHYLTNMSTYLSDGMISAFIQSSSIAMRSDYAEANPLMHDLVGGIRYQIENVCDALKQVEAAETRSGSVRQSAAQSLEFPHDAVDLLATDPPYYHSIPYADLSDMFYVWLKRLLYPLHLPCLREMVTPKQQEATQSLPHSKSPSKKDQTHYERAMRESFEMARLAVRPGGLGFVVSGFRIPCGSPPGTG